MTQEGEPTILIYDISRPNCFENQIEFFHNNLKIVITECAMNSLLESISGQVHTITPDNGKELGIHKKISKELKCDFYFAYAHSSWLRGTNENTR